MTHGTILSVFFSGNDIAVDPKQHKKATIQAIAQLAEKENTFCRSATIKKNPIFATKKNR